MKAIETKASRRILRDHFGFSPAKGNGTGHDTWVDSRGRTCHPPLRKKEVGYAVVFSLGLELQSKGVVSQRQLCQLLRAC